MATHILMPALSPTMTEGTLARWLKKEGESIKAGDVIAEIETDKATMEVEAVDEGVLGKILVADGTAGVKVNDPIAVLVEAGEKASEPPAKKSAPKQDGGEIAAPVHNAPKAAAASLPNGHATDDRIFISPLARRMAKQAGLSLDGIKGSGPHGRIVRVDIEAVQNKGAAPVAVAPAAAPVAPPPAAAPVPAAPITAPG